MLKMHIVHFITSLEMGGAQAVLYDLITNMPHYSHSVVYIHGGFYEHKFKKSGIQLHQVRGVLSSYDPIFFVQLYRLLKKLNPACLHTLLWSANWTGRLVARILNIPCVSALHNNRSLNGFVRNGIDLLAPKPGVVVAVSQEVKQSFGDENITVIPNGVDQNVIRQQAMEHQKSRTLLELSSEHFVIGSVGRLHPIKRYDLLIECVAHLYEEYPYVRLLIIGNGPQDGVLQEQIERSRLAHVIKIIQHERAYGYYPLFDCFVLSSAQEGVSMALLEAMSCGLSCIVTSEQEVHPVLQSGVNGLVCVGGLEALKKDIRAVIKDKEWRVTMGNKATETVKNSFTSQQMVQAYGALFEAASHQKVCSG